jgi:hypothetical protein
MASKLNIKVGERWLDIPSDAKLKIKLVNNIFYEQKKRRSFSLSLRIPVSSTNNLALNWLFEIGTANSTMARVDCEVYSGRHFMHRAVLEVRKAGASGYSINTQISHGAFDVFATDVNIRDIPAFSDPANAFDGLVSADAYPASNYAGVYFAAFGYEFPQTVRRGLLNYELNERFPYLHFVLKETLNFCGWKGDNMDGSFMADAELQQLHFVNYNSDFQEPTVLPADRLPELTITDMMESLGLMFNAALFFDDASKDVSFELLKDLLNNTPVDWSSKVTRESFERDWGKNVLSGITFQWSDDYYESVERVDLSSFEDRGWQDNDTNLNALGSENQITRIETEHCAFAWQKPQWFPLENVHWWYYAYLGNVSKLNNEEIIGSYATKFGFPAASTNTSKLALAQDENWYYLSDGNEWQKYTYNNYQYVAGDGKRKVSSKIAVPMADRIGDELENHNRRALIAVRDYGIGLSVADGWAKKNFNDLPPMLSINRGQGVDSLGNPHYVGNPNTDRGSDFSSPEIFNTQGTQVGNYRLTWGTDNGLYNTFHKPWFDYVSNGQEVTFMANLTLLDIVNIDLKRPIYVHGAEGFIRELEYELPLTKPVKVTFVKKA